MGQIVKLLDAIQQKKAKAAPSGSSAPGISITVHPMANLKPSPPPEHAAQQVQLLLNFKSQVRRFFVKSIDIFSI